MSSEDIDSSTHPETNSLESDEPAQPVVPPLRIRYVSEINSAEISDASGSSAPKRSWLASPSEADGSTKRTRVETEPDQGAANCLLPSDMDAAAHPSTSPGSRSPKRNAATSDGHEEKDTATGSSSAPVAGQGGEVVVKQEVVVKEEPKDETPSGSNDPVAAAAVPPVTVKKESSVKEEATSSIRDSCQFGIRCYRRNATHRSEMAHPGDQDYRRPTFPDPPLGTPDCPYGDRCYRRNPVHFQQFAHPPSNPEENYRQMKLRKRKIKKEEKKEHSSDLDEEDEDDADFIDDAESDEYIPSDTDNNDTEEFL